MTKEQASYLRYQMGVSEDSRLFRIKGNTEIIKASCLKQAVAKLVGEEFTYTPHWYTRGNRKSWAEAETPWGYKCIVEEV